MRSVTSNRPLRELVAEAKAEVMEEIEDNREEGEEDDAMELTVVQNLGSLFLFFSVLSFSYFSLFVSKRRVGSPCSSCSFFLKGLVALSCWVERAQGQGIYKVNKRSITIRSALAVHYF